MAERVARREDEGVRPDVVVPQPQQPSPFAQQRGPEIGIGTSFPIADQAIANQKMRMLDIELSGPISREDTQFHRRRMSGENARAERSGDEAMAERWRIQSANMRVADNKMEEASDARGRGDVRRAEELEGQARLYYDRALRQEALTDHQMAGRAKFGDEPPPAALLRSEFQTWYRGDANSLKYQQSLDQAGDAYVALRPAFESSDPRARGAKEDLLAHISNLGSSAQYGVSYERATASRYREPVVEVQNFTDMIFGAGKLAEQLAKMDGIGKDLKKMLEDMDEELGKLKKKLEDGKASKEDIEKAKEISEFVNDSGIVLEGVDAKSRPAVSRMLARGAAALLKGKRSEAFAQRQLAREYLTDDPEYRKKIEQLSEKLAKGEITAGAAIKEMRTYREKMLADFDKKPITEKSAAAFAGRLEAFIKTRKLDKELEEGKPAFKKELEDVRAIYKKAIELANKAEMARKAGLNKEAKEYEAQARALLKEADTKVAVLEYAQKLKEAKAPKEMVEAVRSAFSMIGTENDWRGRMAIKAANFFLSNSRFFRSGAGQKVLGAVSGFMSWLTDPKNKIDQEEAGKKYASMDTQSRQTMALGPDIETAARKVKGGPEALGKALNGAKSFIGTDQQWRAEFVMKAVQFYLNNRSKFKGANGEAMLKRLLAFVGMISDPEQKMSADQQKESETYLEKMKAELGKPAPKAAEKPQEKRVEAKPVEAKPPVKFAGLIKLRGERAGAPTAAPPVSAKIERSADDQARLDKLKELKVPQEIIKAVEAAYSDPDPVRRKAVIEAAELYLKYSRFFDAPALAEAKTALFDFMKSLSASIKEGTLTEEGGRIVKERLGRFTQFMEGAKEEDRKNKVAILDTSIVQLGDELARATDPAYKDALQKAIDQAKALRDTLNDPKTADLVTEQETKSLSAGLTMIDSAKRVLDSIEDPKVRKEVEKIVGRSLAAGAAGKSEEAEFQFFLARQYLDADKAYRKILASGSEKLEKEPGTMGALKAEIGKYVTGLVEREAQKIKDKDQSQKFLDYAKSLKDAGESITIDDITRGYFASKMAREYAEIEKEAARKPKLRDGALAITQRGLDSLVAKDDPFIVAQQFEYSRSYLDTDQKGRDEYEKLSLRLQDLAIGLKNGTLTLESPDVKKTLSYAAAYKDAEVKASLLRKEMKNNTRNGTMERGLYERGIAKLEEFKSRLASGEEITPDYEKAVAMYLGFFSFKPSEVLAQYYYSRGIDPREKMDEISKLEGLSKPSYNLSKLGSFDRANLTVVYGYAMDALDKGDFRSYEIYMKYAQGAASSDKKTRELAVLDANNFGMGSVSIDDAQWKAGALHDKVNMERNIKGGRDRDKLDAYFYTVMKAYETGDRNGAAAGKDMLALYTDAILGDKKLGKESLAHVEKYLGKDGLLNKAMKEGRTLAEQLAIERGIEKPTADESVSILAGVQEDTAKMSITLSKDRFDKEAETIRGQNEREQRRKASAYRKENSRLMDEAKRARKRDEKKADGLEAAAALSDYSAFTKAIDEAKELSQKGHDLLVQAQGLRKKAMEEPAKREEYEKQAVELERQGQFLIQQSGDMLEGLKQFDRSMTKIWYGRGANFQMTKAESGRAELWAGVSGLAEISRSFLADPNIVQNDDARKKYQFSKQSLQQGYQLVENQFDLQKQAWQKLEMAEKLAKNNKEFSDKGAGQIVWEGNGGFKHVYYESWDYYVTVKYYGKEEDGVWIPMKESEPGGTYREETETRRGGATMQEVWTQADSEWKRENRVIHDYATNSWDLDKAKGSIYGGNMQGADRKLREVSSRLSWTAAAMQVRNFKDQVSTSNDYSRKFKYYEYWFAKDNFDDSSGYVGRLDSAWDDIHKGYFDRAGDKIKKVENDSLVGWARQDMFNKASSLRDTADSLDGFTRTLDSFNPLGTKKTDLKGGTKEDYDEVVNWVKTHKVTVTDITTGQNIEINPMDAMKGDVKKQQANLRAKADLMEGELMKIKTADEVRLGMMIVRTNDRETLANTENVKEYTSKWIEEGKKTGPQPAGTFAITENTYRQWQEELNKPEDKRNLGQGTLAISEGTAAYIHAASYNESAAVDLDRHKFGWDLSIKSYTEGVMNTLSGAPMARSVKFRHYKGSAMSSYLTFLQIGDGFALNPGDAEHSIKTELFVPTITGKFADVEFTRDASNHVNVPLQVGYTYLGHFKDLLKLSGENALGYTGQHHQDALSEHGGKYLETVAMAAWGFAKNPSTGRYERLRLNEKEQAVMNRYIEDFISMKQEVFGDALKMHEYWISDKTGDYFKKKIEGMMSYNKGLDVLVNAPYAREDKAYTKQLYKVRREAWFEWKNETDPDRKERRWKDYLRLDNQITQRTNAVEWAKGQREWASERGRTKSIMEDAAHKEQWAGPIKVVVYGAAIYFTGGLGAIAIGGMSTVEATISYSDQIQWAGGEHNLTFKEKAMGYGGIAIGMLSTVAPMLGELGLMARAPRLAASMNYTLIGGGIVMAIPQVYDMWKLYQKGEMTGIGFAANVLTAAQPALQIGVHGLHPKPFANKYLRFTSGILFGTPANDKIPDLVRNEMYAVEYRKMAEYSPANADNLAQIQTRVGGMSVDESVTVMKLFEGKTIDINYATELVNNYRKSIRHDQAKTIDTQKIKTFDEYTRDYARAIPPPDIKVRASGEGGTSIVVKGQVKVEEAPVKAPVEPEVKIEVDLSRGSTELETKLTERKQKLIDNEQWGKDDIEQFERVARELEYFRNVPDSQVPEHYKRWVKEPGSLIELAEKFVRNNGGFDGDAGPSARINKPFAFGKFMTEGEFTALHPPETVLPDGSTVVTRPDGTQVKVYHNKEHTANVAQTAHDLALKMPYTKADEAIFGSEVSGGKQKKAEFLMQVGILHDADPMRTPGKPARAAATIEWMDSPDALKLMKEKFGWDPATEDGKLKIEMAKAIIQRTEFPFDAAKTGEKTSLGFPRGKVATYDKDAALNEGATDRIGTRYDKVSPLEHYENMLRSFGKEGDAKADAARAFVLKEAAMLSEYADKSSWYFGKPKGAYDSVIGLGTEAGMDMMGGTSGFLKSIGQSGSFKPDVELAKKLGIDMEYPVIDKVLELLGPDARTNWEATKGVFENISKQGNDAKAQAKAAGLDEDAQKKVGARAVELAAEREKLKMDNEEYPASNRRKTMAMEDPPGFAVAEHLFDKALMAGGMDPKTVRSDPVYAEYISRIMREGDAGKEFAAQGFAKELPQAMERGKLDGELAGRGISGPIADDSRLIMKAARGQDMTSNEQRKILDLPQDLSLRMSKDMTLNDIIDVAHELHRRELSESALRVAAELAKTKGLDDPARTAAADKTKTYVEAYDQIARGVPEQEIITKLGVTKEEVDYLRMQVGLDVHELAGNFALLAIRPDMLQVHQTGENIGTLSKLAVKGNPDTYSQAVITALEGIYGGRSRIPPELIPEKGTTLHDTVKNSAPALKKILEGIRRDIGFEENIFEGFLKLDAAVKKGQEVVDALGQNQRVNKEPQEIGVIVLDGAKTWMKNGLGYGGENWQVHDRAYNGFEVGDMGLIIYMEAAKRFARDNPEIYTKLQTAEGDEVIAVIPRERLGTDPQKAIAEYEQKFRKTLESVALEMGISKDSPLFAALADVNAHGGVVGIKSGEGGAKKFSYGGREYGDLNGALVGLEVGHSLDSLAKKEGGKEAAKRIDGFITDMLGTKPESSLSQLRIERQAAGENGKEIHVDAYATFRIGLESGMRADVQRLAENNGKGVTHVENGLAGPSVVNQMGHPVTDSLSRHFQDALAQSFKKHGIADKVEIYADGPMTFAFRFKGSVDMDTFHAAVKDAGESFPKLMKDRGVDKITKATVASTEVESPNAITGTVKEVKNGIVTIRDMTIAEKRVQAEKKARDRMKAPIIGEMFQYRAAARGADQRVAALISDAHLFYKVDGNKVVPAYSETSVLRTAFTDGNGRLIIDESVMAALEKVAAKKWIRTPEDLINHFRESKVSEENIEAFFKVLGFERISEAKADLGGKNVGAVFRRGDEKAGQVVLEAGGGEVAAPVPGKPQPAPMGADAVKTYKLDTPDGLAEFARKVALGDKDATAALENLPLAAKKMVNEMAGDPAFARIAKSDYLFKSYIEDTTGHGRKLLSEYSEKIGKLVTPAVAGEVVQKPQEAKPAAEEPKVVVMDQGPAPDKVREALSSVKNPKLAEAYESFTRLSVKDQDGIIGSLREQARAKAEEATRLEAQGKPASAEDARDHAAKLEKRAVFLTELSALSGETGRNLETAYGLKPGELSGLYREGHVLEFARQKVAEKLGITTDHNDDFIFGMLLSGNLAGLLKEIHPNAAKIEMSVVGKGGTGAYMVKVTDADGTVHTEFVKKVDMRPDAAGAENLRLSGVPAPQVITTTKSGIPLSYVQPDGKISPYGITRSIGDFNGTLKLAGKDISLTTDSAVSLYDMMNSPALMDIFINNPKEFWKQLGYMNAAGYAVGAVDAHPGNVYGMIMNLKSPTQADITALRQAGYHVWESNGTHKMFMLGRIDTDDSGGTYRASGEKGNFDFSSYRQWMGTDSIFPKVITHLTKVRNEHEASGARWKFELPADKLQLANDKLWPVRQGPDGNYYLETGDRRRVTQFENEGLKMISAPAKEPQFITADQLVKEGFGSGGGFYEGVKGWAKQHIGNQEYENAIRDGFRRREGEPAGVSSLSLNKDEEQKRQASGVGHHNYPANGEAAALAFSGDNRTILFADYETVDLKKADTNVSRHFPENKTVFVAPVTEKQARGSDSAFKVGDKWFMVYPDEASVPADLKGKAMGVMQNRDVLRAPPGFGEMTGMQSKKLGAVHAFDYIMGLKEKGFLKEFMKLEEMYLDWEKGQAKAFKENPVGAALVFWQRMPPDFAFDAYFAAGDRGAPPPITPYTKPAEAGKPAQGAKPSNADAPTAKAPSVEAPKPTTEENIGVKSMTLRDAKSELDRTRQNSPDDKDAISKAQTKYDNALKELGALMPNESITEVERKALGLDKKFTKEQDTAARELAGNAQLANLAEGVINNDKEALSTMALLADHPVRKIVEQLAADTRFREALARKDGSDIDIANNYTKEIERTFLEMKKRAARGQETPKVEVPSNELVTKAAQGDTEASKNLADRYAKMTEPKNDMDSLILGEIERRVAAGKSRKDAAGEVVEELLGEAAKVSYNIGLDQSALDAKGPIASWTVDMARSRADQNGRLIPNAEDIMFASALKRALGHAIEGEDAVRLLGKQGAEDLRKLFSGKEAGVEMPRGADLIFLGVERMAEVPQEKLPQAIDAYVRALADAKTKFSKIENSDNFSYAFDHGITHLVENAPPDKVPDLLAKYAETAAKLTKEIKLGAYHSSTEEEASARVFEIAAVFHINGVKDPMAILANGKSGIVDLFLSSPESFRDFPLIADDIIGLISKMPDGVKFKVQKKGKDAKLETVEVSRGQIIETTLPWLLGDMTKMADAGNRERYFNIFKASFEWHSPDAYRLAEKLAKDPNALLELASGLARGEREAKEKLRTLGDHPVVLIVETAADAIKLKARENKPGTAPLTKADTEAISFDAKPYSKMIKEGLYPQTFQEQYGKLLADSVKSGKPIEKNELPILLYAMKDPQGVFPTDAFSLALENDFFKKKMENRAVFDSVAGLLIDVDLAMKESSRGARSWLSMVEDNLMYLLVEETSSAKKPPALIKEMLKSETDPQRKKALEDRLEDYIEKRKGEKLKDSREDFASSKVQHLRNIWSSRNAIGQRGLMEMADAMKGHVGKADFAATLGGRYVELYSSEAKFSEDQKKDISKFAIENTELFLQIYAYRKNISRFTDPSNIPKDYKGKPESFQVALEILDKALLAQARGEFMEFKFSDEFRNELIKKYGKSKGAAIFDQWSTEVPVLVENSKYQIYETGKFGEGFNCGLVKGATACQSPSNPMFFSSSVVGSMELPWIKQVAVKVPGEPEALYRRWLMLVHSDKGKPVLLVQQEYYSAGSFPEGAAIDKQIISALKKRYEPLGIEVRPVKANNKESKDQKNYGYGTFESGRSPFFYIDSNMYSMGHVDMPWHGHHERTPGKSVDFGKGWSKDHMIKTEVP